MGHETWDAGTWTTGAQGHGPLEWSHGPFGCHIIWATETLDYDGIGPLKHGPMVIYWPVADWPVVIDWSAQWSVDLP